MLLLLSDNDEEVDNDTDFKKNCDHELRSLLRIGERKREGWARVLIFDIKGNQGGINCANRQTGFIDSKGSHQ